MSDTVISDFKEFNWQKIINWGNSLNDLNDAQFRFLKGHAVEIAIEKFADGDLTYVAEVHRDYVWPKHNISVEAKTQFSAPMFDRNGNLKDKFDIKINNSNGTNKKTALNPNDVADYVLVVRKDGAFVVDKETVIHKSKGNGDGFTCTVGKQDIIPITGKLNATVVPNGIRKGVDRIIRESLENI